MLPSPYWTKTIEIAIDRPLLDLPVLRTSASTVQNTPGAAGLARTLESSRGVIFALACVEEVMSQAEATLHSSASCVLATAISRAGEFARATTDTETAVARAFAKGDLGRMDRRVRRGNWRLQHGRSSLIHTPLVREVIPKAKGPRN